MNVQPDTLSRRVQDQLNIGDRCAQDTCLLPPKLFMAMSKFSNESIPHKQIEEAIKNAYKDDSYYLGAIEWLNSYGDITRPNFPPDSLGHLKIKPEIADDESDDNGFTIENNMLFYNDKLYVPESLCLMIMIACHDSPLAGHFGQHKTKELVERDYWWPKMTAMIELYVKMCDVCQQTKTLRHKVHGLLHLLPIASERWRSVTMDFITELPECDSSPQLW